MKQKILGAVLLAIGLFNIILDAALHHPPDPFHLLMIGVGVFLLLPGLRQRRRPTINSPDSG